MTWKVELFMFRKCSRLVTGKIKLDITQTQPRPVNALALPHLWGDLTWRQGGEQQERRRGQRSAHGIHFPRLGKMKRRRAHSCTTSGQMPPCHLTLLLTLLFIGQLFQEAELPGDSQGPSFIDDSVPGTVLAVLHRLSH